MIFSLFNISKNKSFVYIINNKGPRMEPCGTPQRNFVYGDTWSLITIRCCLFAKYDVKNFIAFKSNPYSCNF